MDPTLPVVLAAHASVQGAKYGAERSVMLGADLVLPGSLVRDPRLDYVALGHIHKWQDLNEGLHPPVVYPGSIERVDFGEAHDDKFFVIADVQRGVTKVAWHRLEGRRFIDRHVHLTSADNINERVLGALPPQDELCEAVVRLVITYPQDWDSLLDEGQLRRYAEAAFEFHLVRRPQREARLRLPQDQTISSLTPLDLLDVYWRSLNADEDEAQELQAMARKVITSVSGLSDEG